MAKRTNRPEDDQAVTAASLVEMDETRDYIARGRAFKGREDVEVLDLWVAAFENLFATRTAGARLMVDDLQAELRLRKIKPPEDRIKTILEKTTAEMFEPGAEKDKRWDDLERKFQKGSCWAEKPKKLDYPPRRRNAAHCRRDDMAPQKKAPAAAANRGVLIFATSNEAEFFHRRPRPTSCPAASKHQVSISSVSLSGASRET